jgi:hypothetical protein
LSPPNLICLATVFPCRGILLSRDFPTNASPNADSHIYNSEKQTLDKPPRKKEEKKTCR